MQPKIPAVLIGLASALCFIATGYAQNFNGRWEGYYSCGAHALCREAGQFSWKHLDFVVADHAISTKHDFFNNLRNEPASAYFSGRIDNFGYIRINVIARNHQSGSENFHQTLVGRV